MCTWTLAAALTLGGAAHAAGLTAQVDRNQVQVGDQIVLTLTLDGTQSARFELPDLAAFDVYDRGPSTQMQVRNGQISTSVRQTYILVAKRPGTFTVGAVRASAGGDAFTSQPFQIQVLAAGEQPKSGRDLFLAARVSKRRPYAGEFFLYTLRFHTRVRIAGGSIAEPELAEFIKHSVGDERSYRTTIGGVEYQVNEFTWALQAQKPGRVRIGPASVKAEVVMRDPRRGRRSLFDDFFDSPFGRARTEARTVRSNAIDLEVQPLPPAPSGFAGLIGTFTVQADLSQRQLHVGESTTLTVRVSGRGNAAAIGEPAVRGLDDFKVYDDKPSASIETDAGGQHGSKTYKKALVPLREGELTIPEIVVTYFDPEPGAFRRARAGPFVLTALPPTGEEELKLTEFVSSGTGKVAVRVLADDILPIHRRVDALDAHGLNTGSRWLFGGGLLAPALVGVGVIGLRRRRDRLAADRSLRRSRSALKNARRAARSVADAAGVSRVLRGYIGDRLDLEGGALTAAEAGERLRAAGASAELAREVESTLEACDAARYGGGRAELPELGPLLARVDKAVKP